MSRLADETSVSDFTLEIERPLALAKRHEIALLRKAVAANPASVPLRGKLALFLFIKDEFDEALALYRQLMAEAPSAEWAVMLAECHISKETPQDDRASEQYARQAAALAGTDEARAQALAALGKALTRQDKRDEAREVLMAALEANPAEVNAYKRLATLDLDAGATGETLATADRLIDRGVGHARLLVARALALASLGRIDEAREAIGLDRFLHREMLSPPEGWPDIAALNADVRAELERHPDLRFDRYGTASTRTWRIDEPAFAASRAIPALQALIRQAVLDQVARLDSADSIWTRRRPAGGILHNWCVLTDADGFEEWHVHQSGWMSGVYYVDVPRAVAAGSGREGCIAFGLPDNLVGADNAKAYGETIVRPEPGLLMLFPSHAYHRTFAHGSDGRRICLAFDIQPA